jgi:hypothetical protein
LVVSSTEILLIFNTYPIGNIVVITVQSRSVTKPHDVVVNVVTFGDGVVITAAVLTRTVISRRRHRPQSSSMASQWVLVSEQDAVVSTVRQPLRKHAFLSHRVPF